MKSYFLLLRQVISQRRVVDVHKNTVNEQSRVAVHTLQYSKVLKLYFDCSPNIAFPEDSFSMRYLCLRLPRLLESSLSLSCCEDIQYNSISLLFGIAHCGDLKKYLSLLGCHHLTSKCVKNVFIAVLQHMPFLQVTRNTTSGERVTLTESCLRERILQRFRYFYYYIDVEQTSKSLFVFKLFLPEFCVTCLKS